MAADNLFILRCCNLGETAVSFSFGILLSERKSAAAEIAALSLARLRPSWAYLGSLVNLLPVLGQC